jgi:putative DNA methylase
VHNQVIPRECKRLAEVDFPVAEVSRHSAREKSIRHGHPSTLHLWWARRPLAACRAMLMALLLPDPCDPACPGEFKSGARRLLDPVPGVGPKGTDKELQKGLLRFIADFANWDNAANQTYLECARGLVRAAHGEETPLVVDPFAGGGSIPLEALRIGCDAFASDLNPVACLILKVLLEDIPRHGPGLADELRRVGKQIKEVAEKELAEFYPPDPDGARPIAYLWARTVRCEAPKCGAEIPLIRSFWLCRKQNRRRALRFMAARPRAGPPRLEYEIFAPSSDADVPTSTVAGARATCPSCGSVLPPNRVCAQLKAQHGGADAVFCEEGGRKEGATLLAVVTLSDDQSGRNYRLQTDHDYKVLSAASKRLTDIAGKPLADELNVIPDEPLPPIGTLGFRVQRYGMLKWGDLFTVRQKLALATFQKALRSQDCSFAAKSILALTLSHVVDRSASLCRWRAEPYMETVESVYGRQALPIVWDFAEAVLLSESTGSFSHALSVVSQCVETATKTLDDAGQVQVADARELPLPDAVANLYFTDPPYYDAIPYADLSDFFYVWLKRSLHDHPVLKNHFETNSLLTPKIREIVQDDTKCTADGKIKDKSFFEESMRTAFVRGKRVLREDGIGAVVFAHKTTEGWEALVSGILSAQFTVTASWPITTEMANRMRARESAALAASVHLVCRPRPANAGIGGWEDVLRELPNRIGDWMERLSSEGIRGADLVFSCIGPALELFSKYDKVVDAQDREIPLGGDPEAAEAYKRGFLAYIWEIVGRVALQQVLGTAEARARNSAAGALEEDARLTALFLWTLQSNDVDQNSKAEMRNSEEEGEESEATDEDEEKAAGKPKKGFTLIYDVVRRFAQPLGIHLEAWDGRIIEVKKGVVRLLSVPEREEQLFGSTGTHAVARALERTGGRDPQFMLFPEQPEGGPSRGRKPRRSRAKEEAEALAPRREATTLDRVHAAMLLQARGEATALRALLEAEIERSPDFLRLANALSALYPKDSEEKRLLDAMLLAVSR